MKHLLHVPARSGLFLFASLLAACGTGRNHLYLDVHHVGPGKVTCAGVAEAHAKDLAVEASHHVDYQRYWVDETTGTIYCLVSAPSAAEAAAVHGEAHGLLADEIHEVAPGILPAAASGEMPLFMDTHQVAPGTTAAEVADAHRKDLAAQGAHGVRFLEYWVDEKTGRVHCLAQAPNAEAMVATHRDAHGLLPETVVKVVAGK